MTNRIANNFSNNPIGWASWSFQIWNASIVWKIILYAISCTGMIVCIIQSKWDLSHYLYAISNIVFLCFQTKTHLDISIIRYDSNWDIIKYLQLLTHIHRNNDSGRRNQTIIASHQRWPKLFSLLVIRTRNILLP